MITKQNLLLILLLSIVFSLNAQEEAGTFEPKTVQCLSPTQRNLIKSQIEEKILEFNRDNHSYSRTHPTFVWPVQGSSTFDDPGFYYISAQVDHNPATGELMDYNCGERTYDTESGYDHKGTDIAMWPFGWRKMDNNDVEIVAAADGKIILKHDGEYDENCSFGDFQWNAVYLEHSDGSVTWYGHMKSGSLTSKPEGSYVSQGEYLGVIGSSGVSTGPHLHFEVYDSKGDLIDPFGGSCNGLNHNDSWWVGQKDYHEVGVQKVMTAYGYPTFNDCNTRATTKEKNIFKRGEKVYTTAYFKSPNPSLTSTWKLYRPDNSIEMTKTWTATDHFRLYWSGFHFTLSDDAQNGIWTWEIYFDGKYYKHSFQVGKLGKPNLAIEAKGTLQVDGTNITISNLYVKNIGDTKSKSSRLGYYLSTNNNITTSDILIGTDYVKSLEPGRSSKESISVDVSNLSLDQGTYYVGVIADHKNIVAESKENDNSRYWSSPKVEIPCVCTYIWDPVCGSDGNTYGNSCEAECAGITEYTNGECNTGCFCSDKYANSICEDFDAYSLGKIGSQSSCWTTWSGYDGGAEDAHVMGNDDFHYLGIEGTNSNGGAQDVVLQLGDRTSGKYILEFYIFIYEGEKGYYNILHTFNPGSNSNQWAQDVYFDGSGSGRLHTGGYTTYFNYPTSRWFKVRQEINISTNRSYLFVDGNYVRKWNFRYQNNSTAYGEKRISAINFYPLGTDYRFFIDEIQFDKVGNFTSDSNDLVGFQKERKMPVVNDIMIKKDDTSKDVLLGDFSVYPNPVRDKLTIELPLSSTQDVDFYLMNAVGQVVVQQKYTSDFIQEEIDVSNLPKGIYFARVSFGDENLVKKVIVLK